MRGEGEQTYVVLRSLPSKVISCSILLRTSRMRWCRSRSDSFVFRDTLSRSSSTRYRGKLQWTYPSNTSSTPLLTRSPTSFHPTCRSHQLSVRYLFSSSSLILYSSSSSSFTLTPENKFSNPLLPPSRILLILSSDASCSRRRSSCSC